MRDRIDWLNTTGVPSTRVLDWSATDMGACLVTRAVPGISAGRVDPQTLRRVWPSVVETVRTLHDLPVHQCLFDRTLATR